MEWTGHRNKDGYGTFGKGSLAHRVAYAEAYGDPGKMYVLHRCDNPGCVRPSHLFLGTQRDNVHDCMAKGRRAPQSGLFHSHKLSADDVREIRDLYATGKYSQSAIAERFDVSQVMVSKVVRRSAWSAV